MKKIVLCLTIFVSGCAMGTGVKPTFTKAGKQHYEAICNGGGRSMSDCYAQASEKCGGDFEEFDKNVKNNYVGHAYGVATVEHRTLIFACK